MRAIGIAEDQIAQGSKLSGYGDPGKRIVIALVGENDRPRPLPVQGTRESYPSDVTKLTCCVTITGVAVGDGVGVAALLVGAAPCEVPQPERSDKRTSRNKIGAAPCRGK